MQISNASPGDDATDVNIEANLTWTNPTGTTETIVYFGEDSTPDAGELVIEEEIATTYNPTLAVDTTYYWKVDIVHAGGTETGVTYSFTTAPGPPQPEGTSSTLKYSPYGQTFKPGG